MPTMLRHDDPLVRAAGFLIGEAHRCGLYVCDTVHYDGKEYTVRVKAYDALREQTYIGTIPELLREFDAYAEGCRRRGRR